MGRPRSVATGLYLGAAIEAVRNPLGLVKAGPALLNKTIPYRFVLVKEAEVPRFRQNAVLTELSAGGTSPNGRFGNGLDAARWSERAGQEQPDR